MSNDYETPCSWPILDCHFSEKYATLQKAHDAAIARAEAAEKQARHNSFAGEAYIFLEAHIKDLEAQLAEVRVALDDDFFELIVDSMAEADRAMRKFPQPNYVISKIAEEAGEVVKAAIHAAEGRETHENVRGEMRQLIAMLYRLWVEGDQVHGLQAVRPSAQIIAQAGKGAGDGNA
jgi:hypothetical protein